MSEGVVHLPVRHQSSRLPKRFPVGTTFVVEGTGGETGQLRVVARYVVLPDGERINVPVAAAAASEAAMPRLRRAAACRRGAGDSRREKASKTRTRPHRKKIPTLGGTPRRSPR